MNHSIQTTIYWIGKFILIGVIVYFGIIGILQPEMFARMVPTWLLFIPATILVIIHGIIMVMAALMVFINRGGWYAYGILALSLLAVLMSVSGMIFIRDLAILGGVLILSTHSYRKTP
jgi:hypothetical protein